MDNKNLHAISQRLARCYQLLAGYERQLSGTLEDSKSKSSITRSKQRIEERIAELELELVTPAEAGTPLSEQVALNEVSGYLEDPDPLIRFWAVGQLADHPHPQAFPYLVRALKDQDPEVRCKAVGGLGCFGKYGARSLIGVFKDRDHRVRNAAVTSLANIGPEVLPFFLPILKDEGVEMHILVVATLREIGPAIAPQLQEMLKWPYPNVVYSVITALSDIGNAECLPMLHSFATGHWQPTSWGGSLTDAASSAIKKIEQRISVPS